MLTALHLGNFKAFGKTQKIPLKPITLVFGANSAGKSSLIHSFCLANEAMRTGDLDVYRTNIGGESVDLGGFRQYVHRRDTQRRVEWGVDIETAKMRGRTAELFAPVKKISVFVQIGLRHVERTRKQQITNPRTEKIEIVEVPTGEAPIPVGKPFVAAYEIFADDKSILSASRQPEKNLQLNRLEHRHPIFNEVIKALVQVSTTTESLSPEDFEAVGAVINEVVPDIEIDAGKFLPSGLVRSEDFRVSGGMTNFMPISRGRREDDLANAVRMYIPNILHEMIKGLTEAIYQELNRFSYLGPLRSYPPRHLAFAQYHDTNWEAGGGSAWDKVRRDDKLREIINEWLSNKERLKTPYQLDVRKLYDIEELRDPLENIIYEYDTKKRELVFRDVKDLLQNSRLNDVERQEFETELLTRWQDLDLQDEEIENFNEYEERGKIADKTAEGLDSVNELSLIDLRSNTKVSHRDVGIGISQVLPVLVNAYASAEKIIAIEQPEIHLHPALQAELGDVFINSALGDRKNSFIIETHSEHLILRIMRRLRNTSDETLPEDVSKIKPHEVAVLYVQPGPDNSNSVVSVLELDEEGQLLDPFPGGFFEEGFKERFS
ncbi:MAG TPA: AAA family ATPase [Pyrinomonadaceae bacterium]|nr:AAA family ATPase [Pyrinomonadaceae bacterium]